MACIAAKDSVVSKQSKRSLLLGDAGLGLGLSGKLSENYAIILLIGF